LGHSRSLWPERALVAASNSVIASEAVATFGQGVGEGVDGGSWLLL
jgi:hypothetical protein